MPRLGPTSWATPVATCFSESMSRPESVSSKIAISGSRTASWRISFRFFSPPENPWFTYRFTMASSTPRVAIFSFMCLRNASALTSGSLTDWYAVRRKFTTETPGTSTGYCIARNRPSLARWSVVSLVTSSPLKRPPPAVTVYPGRPMITLASVDLPEPFGPISACVSPCRTVRSIPSRISLPSTEARSSRTSSVALPSSVIAHLDQQVVALHLHRERLDRDRGRQRPRPPGREVERGTVLRALDRPEVDVHLAFVEEVVRVRADRVDRAEAFLAEVHHGDRPVVHLEAPGLALGNVVGGAQADEAHDRPPSSRRGGRAPPPPPGSSSSNAWGPPSR